MIAFELCQLGHQVVNATEAHRKRKPYLPPKACCTPTIKFLSAILDGKVRPPLFTPPLGHPSSPYLSPPPSHLPLASPTARRVSR